MLNEFYSSRKEPVQFRYYKLAKLFQFAMMVALISAIYVYVFSRWSGFRGQLDLLKLQQLMIVPQNSITASVLSKSQVYLDSVSRETDPEYYWEYFKTIDKYTELDLELYKSMLNTLDLRSLHDFFDREFPFRKSNLMNQFAAETTQFRQIVKIQYQYLFQIANYFNLSPLDNNFPLVPYQNLLCNHYWIARMNEELAAHMDSDFTHDYDGTRAPRPALI